jgi:hypothetical protein
MMIACACGGIGETALILVVVSAISALFTKWYNRRQCRKHECQHRCN